MIRTDEMRLQDGAKAIQALAGPEPVTLKEHEAQLKIVMQGARALQSLGDLGSDMENKKAWNDMNCLLRRMKALEERTKVLRS